MSAGAAACIVVATNISAETAACIVVATNISAETAAYSIEATMASVNIKLLTKALKVQECDATKA